MFVQYLFGLAVVRACRDERALGGVRGADVRLKWPNDIYLDVDGVRKKIGGILVNTSFTGGQVEVIIGTSHPPAIVNMLTMGRVRCQCFHPSTYGIAFASLSECAAQLRNNAGADSQQVRKHVGYIHRESWLMGTVRGHIS